MKIYIAAPYTSNPEQNTQRVLKIANQLIEKGYTPVIPHLYHYLHLTFPHDYEIWQRLGWELLEGCDIVLRLGGESPGADQEVQHAHKHGITVFSNGDNDLLDDLFEFLTFREWYCKKYPHHLAQKKAFSFSSVI